MIAALIFDCDGVLVDSEPITNRIFRHGLREIGLDLTMEEMHERFIGRSMDQCVEIITGMLGHKPPADFVTLYRTRIHEALRLEVKAIPGIETVLDSLDIPFCVASSGNHDKMQVTLGTTGLLPRFEGRRFSVTEVAHSKPAPDVFLHAAKQCGADPSRCLVVEDTPTGVRAGIAAGMTVFGFAAATSATKLREAGAHRTFAAMSELPSLIRG